MRDYGRDMDIGIPPTDTININILDGGPVIVAVNDVTKEIETNSEEIRKVRIVNEHILGEEVEFIDDDV